MGKIYICKFCRKPLTQPTGMHKAFMEIMDMPEDGGAHAACLRISDVVPSERKASRKLAPNTTIKSKGADNADLR